MDYMVLNALGITVMALLGLWVFYRAAQHGKKKPPRKDDERGDA